MSTLGFLLLIAEAFQMAAAGTPEVAAPTLPARPLPSTVRVVRDASGPDALSSPVYAVDCKIIGTPGMTISLPRVALRDGEKITMSDTDQRAIVVATRNENGATIPVKETVTEGSTAEMVVRGLGEDRILLDVSFDARGANANPTEAPQSVQVHVVSGRVIKSGKVGETITTEFSAEKWKIEAVVTRATSETAAGK